MPLSLKLPEGFMPSYCSNKLPADMPTYCPTLSAFWSKVCPSPMVTTMLGVAKGKRSRNLQTPEKFRGSRRLAHLASKSDSRRATGRRSQSETTSTTSPQAGHEKCASSIEKVVAQAVWMHC